MKNILILPLTLFILPCLHAAPKPERIALWDNHAPIGEGKFKEEDAWIHIHRPAKPNGAAVVICPGGGYGMQVMGAEGHGIATWLNGHGVTGVVLQYRLPRGRPFVPLGDAQQAIRLVRYRAKEWKLDPDKIGIMGFSAGGHLASTAATHFDAGKPKAKHLPSRLSCRPDFAILVYPVVTMGKHTHRGSKRNLLGNNPTDKMVELFSNEKQVTEDTPPIFLAHAVDDRPVPPENSRALYAALQKNKVPSEYLELPNGGHGLNGYKGPSWNAWQADSMKWLEQIKVIRKE